MYFESQHLILILFETLCIHAYCSGSVTALVVMFDIANLISDIINIISTLYT